MGEFEIPGWDLVSKPSSSVAEAKKPISLSVRPDWNPTWHRGMGEVFAKASPDSCTDEELRAQIISLWQDAHRIGLDEAAQMVIAMVRGKEKP